MCWHKGIPCRRRETSIVIPVPSCSTLVDDVRKRREHLEPLDELVEVDEAVVVAVERLSNGDTHTNRMMRTKAPDTRRTL